MTLNIITAGEIPNKRIALQTITKVMSYRAKDEEVVFMTEGKASHAIQSICSDGISWIDTNKLQKDKNKLVAWTRYLFGYSKITKDGVTIKEEESVE